MFCVVQYWEDNCVIQASQRCNMRSDISEIVGNRGGNKWLERSLGYIP